MSKRVIEVRDLVKRFGHFVAVDHISFHVEQGEIFGFLGANGAGKSTAMKMLCGLSKPTSGEGYVAGLDIIRENEQIKQRIGYMSQSFSLYEELTVKENIRLFAGIYGMSVAQIREKTQKLLQELQIYDYRNTRVRALPLGWRQRLAFTIAVFHEPEIVFLDEPTGGVDPATRRCFWELIYDVAYNKGITVFVTTHYMDEAEYCDRLSIMADGQIKAIGAPQILKAEYEVETIDELFREIARGSKRIE